jgi:hypothetical protein
MVQMILQTSVLYSHRIKINAKERRKKREGEREKERQHNSIGHNDVWHTETMRNGFGEKDCTVNLIKLYVVHDDDVRRKKSRQDKDGSFEKNRETR